MDKSEEVRAAYELERFAKNRVNEIDELKRKADLCDELVNSLKNFANLDRSVPSGLWAVRSDYCEEARALLSKTGA